MLYITCIIVYDEFNDQFQYIFQTHESLQSDNLLYLNCTKSTCTGDLIRIGHTGIT